MIEYENQILSTDNKIKEINYADMHCHLQDSRYGDMKESIIKNAISNGVKYFVCNSTDQTDWEAVRILSEKYEEIYPAYGVHPWYIENIDKNWLQILENYLKDNKSSIGEIGLDRTIKNYNEKKQEYIFEEQLNLAVSLKKPVSIHCRKTWDRLIPILKKYTSKNLKFLVHSFSGSTFEVKILKDIGCYFSFSGSVTKKNNQKIIFALNEVPIDRLLIETDSPDILPDIEGRYDPHILNEPSNIKYIFDEVCKIKEYPKEQLADIIFKNSLNFLGIKNDI